MNIAVLGSGSWGTALAQVLADNGHEVVLWSRNPAQADEINQKHQNSRYFDTLLHENIRAVTDIREISGREVILLAVPSVALEQVLTQAVPHVTMPAVWINTAKGFHPETHERLSSFLTRTVPKEKRSSIVSLIGPSHAEEVVKRQATAINAVSVSESDARIVQKLFSNQNFRVYVNTDVIGAEIGVALKNIIALASGMLEGQGQGDNAKAALITRGLAEMTRFGIACGGRAETFLGLDGVGDLVVTCTSRHSRNFCAGYEIGKAGSAKSFLEHNTKTVEGISACKVVFEEAQSRKISMPITSEVHAVLFEGKNLEDAGRDLMMRSLKTESL